MKGKLLFGMVVFLLAACGLQPPSPTSYTEYSVQITCGTGLGKTTKFLYTQKEPVCEVTEGNLACSSLGGPAFQFSGLGYIVVEDSKLISSSGYCSMLWRREPTEWVVQSNSKPDQPDQMVTSQYNIAKYLALTETKNK